MLQKILENVKLGKMAEREILLELNTNSRWLTDEYKNIKYYKEYIRLLFEELIETYTT